MGLLNRLNPFELIDLDDLNSEIDNLEPVLEQALIGMQEDLIELRQAVDKAIAIPKCEVREFDESQVNLETATQLMNNLHPQVEQQEEIISLLQKNIEALEKFEKLVFESAEVE